MIDWLVSLIREATGKQAGLICYASDARMMLVGTRPASPCSACIRTLPTHIPHYAGVK